MSLFTPMVFKNSFTKKKMLCIIRNSQNIKEVQAMLKILLLCAGLEYIMKESKEDTI